MRGGFSERTQTLKGSPARKTAHSSKAALAKAHCLIAGSNSDYSKSHRSLDVLWAALHPTEFLWNYTEAQGEVPKFSDTVVP